MRDWAIEIAGVALIAVGLWMAYPPLGVAIVGAYALLVANTEEDHTEEESSDASTKTRTE